METFEQAKKVQKQMVKDRRWLHQNPEVGMHIPNTTQYVKKRLTEMGYNPQEICENGITATVGKGNGKVILLRADMDALPVQEETGEAFASTNGNMHACGHDLHTAILLGTAQMLKDRENEIEGTVKLMFQPAEETFEGANIMLESGILENPKVDVALALHVAPGMIGCGQVALLPGSAMASCNGFKIKILGKGTHGAMPEGGVDPINIGSHIVQNLQVIPSRETSLSDGALVTIGLFKAGNAANVIPHTAELQGTLRTFNEGIREDVLKRIETIARDTAKMFKGDIEFEIISDVPSLTNDVDFSNTIQQYILETPGLPDFIVPMPKMPGSEDFACVTNQVPGMMFWLGAPVPDQKEEYSPHHPKCVYNEEAMPTGAAIFTESCIRWLRDNK